MKQKDNLKLIEKIMFRLLPLQILLAVIPAVNGIVSGLFASNFIGEDAMSVVALYAPVTQLLSAVNLMLMGGSQILCGQFMGRNQKDRASSLFSLNMIISTIIACVIMVILLSSWAFDLTRFIVKDAQIRVLFNRYIAGQAVGIIPLMLGQQMSAFLSLENRMRRTTAASVAFIVVNFILDYLFIVVMHYGVFGLALASSIGCWVFFLIQLFGFAGEKGFLRFSLRNCQFRDFEQILKIGLPGSLSQGYQTVRRLIVNSLVLTFVGSVGLSAFAASDMLFGVVWAVPNGMLAVSRMMMSISIGEEDRQSLANVMRVMFRRFVPIMAAISVLISVFAVPLTRMFYQDPSAPVFDMAVWGFRILPFCMPLSMIMMHFVCFGQEANKQILVHTLSVADGVLDVAGFSALLVPFVGIRGVFEANILNGVVTTLIILIYSFIKNGYFPRNMAELMVIPETFGVPAGQRMDLSLKTIDEVISVSEAVQTFYEEQGIEHRRAMLAGLCMEEMAGNVISHGFTKDNKKHTVDVRVVRKNNDVIMRIKDDCVYFDPIERLKSFDPDDPFRNVGIQLATSIAKDVSYQSILGLNVLTIKL